MKKIISIGVIFLSLSLFGCANDNYAVEKQYWHIQKQAEKIFKNPVASPPRELERVVGLLNGFAGKHQNSNFAVVSEFTIARLYLVKEEYDKARSQLKDIAAKYKKTAQVCSEAFFLIGNSYEMQNNWDSALRQYDAIIKDYPVTLKGLDLPIYIAQHYKIKNQPDKMVSALQEAVVHYKTLGAKYPNSQLSYNTDNLVLQCQLALKDWQSAINSLNTLIDNYKGKLDVGAFYINIAMIYSKELKDYAKAKEALGTLIKEYPKSRMIKTATALSKELEKKWMK